MYPSDNQGNASERKGERRQVFLQVLQRYWSSRTDCYADDTLARYSRDSHPLPLFYSGHLEKLERFPSFRVTFLNVDCRIRMKGSLFLRLTPLHNQPQQVTHLSNSKGHPPLGAPLVIAKGSRTYQSPGQARKGAW